jgi:hypothetical protein
MIGHVSTGGGVDNVKEGQSILNMLLKSELLGMECFSPRQNEGKGDGESGSSRSGSSSSAHNLFKFKVRFDGPGSTVGWC